MNNLQQITSELNTTAENLELLEALEQDGYQMPQV